MKQFFKDFDKYYIGIETADGHKLCIRGWYLDCRLNHEKCPRGYNMYEFRESDDGNNYLACIESHVLVNHSGTFVTKTKIPFGENGNPKSFCVRYGHYY
ncbi:MAG: hypothetical protein IJ588_01775 [Prevotella sp.]|nr:hypothetical protein [Prevotella sp.]